MQREIQDELKIWEKKVFNATLHFHFSLYLTILLRSYDIDTVPVNVV